METVREPKGMALLFRSIPPLICLVEYFAIVAMAMFVVLTPAPWFIRIITIALLCVGLLMAPFWYKTFFDRTFIGPDRPLLIQWSPERVLFSGGYFKLDVPMKDILGFQPIGYGGSERTFILKVRIRKPNGKQESTYLSTTMPRKHEFMLFLQQHISHQPATADRP